MLSAAVQVVLPDPVNVLFAHVRELRDGAVVEPDPLNLIETLFDVDPWVAVNVTVCEALTAATVAEKVALFAPEGTVNEAGTVMAGPLLARATASPVLGAAPVNVTVQLSIPEPIIEELEQLNPDKAAVPEFDPFPCSLIGLDDLVMFVERLVVFTSSVPVESAVDFASY